MFKIVRKPDDNNEVDISWGVTEDVSKKDVKGFEKNLRALLVGTKATMMIGSKEYPTFWMIDWKKHRGRVSFCLLPGICSMAYKVWNDSMSEIMLNKKGGVVMARNIITGEVVSKGVPQTALIK